MRTITVIITVFISTLFSSCNMSGQVPGGMRISTTASIPRSVFKDVILADPNFMWDKYNNTRYVKVPVDVDFDGYTEEYTDALGTNAFVVMDYNQAYDVVQNPHNYQTIQGIAIPSIKVIVTAYSEFRFTDKNPSAWNQNQAASQFCAVSVSPQ